MYIGRQVARKGARSVRRLGDDDALRVQQYRLGNAGPVYELDGLGKFKFKKIFKGIGKVLKTVAPIAATFIPGVGPVVGPALMAAQRARVQAKQAAQAAAAPGAGQAEQVAAAWAQNQYQMAQQGAVQQAVAQNQPQYIPPTVAPAVGYPGGEGYYVQPQERAPGGFMSQLPPWAVPAALGGAALLFVLFRKR
jgi:hypothetical protein